MMKTELNAALTFIDLGQQPLSRNLTLLDWPTQ